MTTESRPADVCSCPIESRRSNWDGVTCEKCGKWLYYAPPAPPPDAEIIAHTNRVPTTSEAAREWDSMTQPSARTPVDLPPDAEAERDEWTGLPLPTLEETTAAAKEWASIRTSDPHQFAVTCDGLPAVTKVTMAIWFCRLAARLAEAERNAVRPSAEAAEISRLKHALELTDHAHGLTAAMLADVKDVKPRPGEKGWPPMEDLPEAKNEFEGWWSMVMAPEHRGEGKKQAWMAWYTFYFSNAHTWCKLVRDRRPIGEAIAAANQWQEKFKTWERYVELGRVMAAELLRLAGETP